MLFQLLFGSEMLLGFQGLKLRMILRVLRPSSSGAL
jgi:hypothetical protein